MARLKLAVTDGHVVATERLNREKEQRGVQDALPLWPADRAPLEEDDVTPDRYGPHLDEEAA